MCLADRSLTNRDPGDPADVADPSAVESQPSLAYERTTLPKVTVRSVLILALPAIIEQVIQAAVGVTDTIIVGHIPGDERTVAAGAAAVGVMMYLQWLSGLLNSAFAVGATAIVSRSIGARRPRVANRVAGTALTSAFVISGILATLMYFYSSEVAHLAGLRGLAHEFGTQYLHIMVITIALQAAAMIGMACLRGAGDTVRPMMVTAGVALVNVVTSSAFTYGWFGAPAWGLRGTAFGTMLAYLVGGIATMLLLLGGWSRIKLQMRHLRIVPHIMMRLLRIGMPSWVEGMLLWLGQFLIVILVINANDAAIGIDGVTMAAHNTVLRIESLAFLPGFGFGIACSALVGQYLGAKRPDEAEHAARLCNRLATATMTIVAIPMVLFPQQLLSVMVNSPPVVALGVWPMVLAGLAQPGFAVSIARGAALKGAGETVYPMMATIIGMVVVRVPILIAAWYTAEHFGGPGLGLLAVWIGIFVDLTFRGVFNTLAFRRGTWRHKKV